MSNQADHHHGDRVDARDAADAPLRARKPWRAPIIIDAAVEKTDKFSYETFEGGSYPTTHGPS